MKRGQMKMMESILVLIVFFFLLVFGLIFYASFSQSSDSKRSADRVQKTLDQTFQRIQFMPELQCDAQTSVCIDLFKAAGFSRVMEANKGYYEKLFPNTRINAILIFPTFQNITIFDQTYGDETAMSRRVYRTPITLYDETKKSEGTQFGYLSIMVFYK